MIEEIPDEFLQRDLFAATIASQIQNQCFVLARPLHHVSDVAFSEIEVS